MNYVAARAQQATFRICKQRVNDISHVGAEMKNMRRRNATKTETRTITKNKKNNGENKKNNSDKKKNKDKKTQTRF